MYKRPEKNSVSRRTRRKEKQTEIGDQLGYYPTMASLCWQHYNLDKHKWMEDKTGKDKVYEGAFLNGSDPICISESFQCITAYRF